MLNGSSSLALSTSILKALSGKLDIKRHSPVFSISLQASHCQQAFSKPCLVNLISKDTHQLLYISASLALSTSILKALPGKLDIKRHSPSILYISASLTLSTSILKALPGKLDIKRHSPSILYISASLAMSTIVLKALCGKLDIKRHSPVFSISCSPLNTPFVMMVRHMICRANLSSSMCL